MGGGLMQLVAYGAQDVYLTGNPQITFFKVVYRRHTNFATEAILQTINGNSTLSASAGSGNVTISRNGDLIGKVYVNTVTPGVTNGSKIVTDVVLEIGGQQIDKHTSEWMDVWNELSTTESKALGVKAMTGAVGSSNTTGVRYVQVPLQFWFCRNPGLALPLIALQYHEVKLKFTFGTSAASSVGVAAALEVYVDYIYLDTDERRRFAQTSHEYLIEQIQISTEGTSNTSYKLNMNHPVKELIWTDAASITTQTAKLTLNGHDRFSTQSKEYFQLRQPVDHHTAVPRQNLPKAAQMVSLGRSEVITKHTGAAHTDGAGINNADPTAAQINFVLLGGASTVLTSAPDSDVAVATATTASSAFLIGNLDAACCIKAGTLRQGTKLRIEHYNMSMLAAGTGAGPVTVIEATVKFICGPSETTATASSGTLGPLEAGVAFDNADMDVGGAATIDDTTILVILDSVITLTQAVETAVDPFVITKIGDGESRTSQQTRNINCYSFALKPEEHQPSGTCNFSRIDAAYLEFSAAATVENVYAVSYNVLRIMSGMGGLAYSN